MSESSAAPKLRKWPFYLADIVLSGIAAWVLYRLGAISGTTQMAAALGCLAAAGWAAWLSVTPWLLEYRASAMLAETGNLKSSMEQIQNLQSVAALIRESNAQWQAVQDASGRTVSAAREITEKMKVETDEFMKFIQNAHDQERASMRLEIEKLRRTEGEWIKTVVQMLDHVYAINRAAERSGQQNVIQQLGQFQNACRDAARRVGLAPFVPELNEPFDTRAHQLPDAQFTPPPDSKVGEILATGFTFQGQLLRRALVLLQNPEQPSAPASELSNAAASAPEQPLPPERTEEAAPLVVTEAQVTPEQTAATHADSIENAPGADLSEATPEESTSPAQAPPRRRRAADEKQLPLV